MVLRTLFAGTAIVVAICALLVQTIVRAEYMWWGTRLARMLVDLAAVVVPSSDRSLRRDEWLAELDSLWVEQMAGVLFALTLPLAAIKIRAFGLTVAPPPVATADDSDTQAAAEVADAEEIGDAEPQMWTRVARVAITDGFVVSAVDTEGSRWTVRDLRRASYPRRLGHLLIMSVAVLPVVAVASAPTPTGGQAMAPALPDAYIAVQLAVMALFAMASATLVMVRARLRRTVEGSLDKP